MTTDTLLNALTYAAAGVPADWKGHERAVPVTDLDAAAVALDAAWLLATERQDVARLRLLAAHAPLGEQLRALVRECKDASVRAELLSRADLSERELAQWLGGERNQQVLAAIVASESSTPRLRDAALATGKLAPARAAIRLIACADVQQRPELMSRSSVLTALEVCADAWLKLPQNAHHELTAAASGMSVAEFEAFARKHPGPVAVTALTRGQFTPDEVAEDVLLYVAAEAADGTKANHFTKGGSTLRSWSSQAVTVLVGAVTLPASVAQLLDARLSAQDAARQSLGRHLLPTADGDTIVAARRTCAQVTAAARSASSAQQVRELWEQVPSQDEKAAAGAVKALLSNPHCPAQVALEALDRFPAASAALRRCPNAWAEPTLAALVVTEMVHEDGFTALADVEDATTHLVALLRTCERVRQDPASTEKVRHAAHTVAARVCRSRWMDEQLVGLLPLTLAMDPNVPDQVVAALAERTVSLLAGDPGRVRVLEALAGGFEGTVEEFVTAAAAAVAS